MLPNFGNLDIFLHDMFFAYTWEAVGPFIIDL
jgi:hypothetical protein